MKANDRIHVKEYLNYLNENVDNDIAYNHIKKEYIQKLNCKLLAEKCEVTPATISNLNTSSSYFLIDKIAGEILDAYWAFFQYDESKNKKEYPEENIHPRDKSYVIMCLMTYYSDEWLSY